MTPVTGGTATPRPTLGADRPRLVVIEGIALSSALDPYLSLRALAVYSGCSVRWLRDRLGDPHHPLPSYHPEGKVLVRRSEFDTWMARYRQVGRADVTAVVADVLAGVARPGPGRRRA
jgi:hypothetical protein